jgi:SHS2 domain-containing protein
MNLAAAPGWYTGKMQAKSEFGFRELPHTADWELEVWAPDLARLLEQAAIGMYQLCGAKSASRPRVSRKIELDYSEPETLLIDFLTELIYLTESENLIFDQYHLRLADHQFSADLSGAVYTSLSKEIKAVTYHNLRIKKSAGGLRANITFDV